MGDIINMDTDKTRTRTIKEWAEVSGINPDTARRTVSRKSGTTVGLLSGITKDEWAAWKPGQKRKNIRTASGQNKRVSYPSAPVANVQPVADIQPHQEGISLDSIRQTAFDAICIGIVVGQAVLIWYDCLSRWGIPGLIGGCLAFFAILAALLISTDATRIRTSAEALWFVFVIDVAAWWIHSPTFRDWADGVDEMVTDIFAAFLCAISFAALYLYRSSKID